METKRPKAYFSYSAILIMTVVMLALFNAKGENSTIIHGAPPDGYTITLAASNAPTTSSEYIDTTQTVRYSEIVYQYVKASSSNHVELGSYGGIYNAYTSPITSVTSVVATFTTLGTLTAWTSFDGYSYFDYPLVSGVPLDLPFLPYYVEFWADSEPVEIESIIINYSCTPHAESLDKYRVYWYNGESLLELDSDVDPGTFPSYDGPIPTKDPVGDVFYVFDGWDQELSEVYSIQSYTAKFIEVGATFTLINGNSEYELSSVTDISLTSFTIPSSYLGLPVTSIGLEAFADFINLETVVLPTTIKTISDAAFVNCVSLTSVFIPHNVSSISQTSFLACSSLAAFDVDINNTYYASLSGVLFNKALTTLVTYPAGKGTSYSIPNGVVTIGSGSFIGNSSIQSITIPESVTTIETSAFVACSSLNNVMIPDSVTTIGDGLFVDCTALTTVSLPAEITALPAYIFYNCTNLENVILPSNITIIGQSAFSGCIKLAGIILPEKLTHIESKAFESCSLLSIVTFPSTLLSIKANAFDNCSSLTVVNLPASINFIGTYAFINCPSLTAINVDEANTSYASLDGVLFSEDITTLIAYPTGKTNSNYSIPSSVTLIQLNAFRGNTYLTSVYIPNTVTTILGFAFYLCSNLVINCQASSQPATWDVNWNASSLPVVWDYIV